MGAGAACGVAAAVEATDPAELQLTIAQLPEASLGKVSGAVAAWDLSKVPTDALEQELARRRTLKTAGRDEPPGSATHSSGRLHARIEELVKVIDVNKDGLMSKPEVTKWLHMLDFSPDVEALVDEMDLNGDGTIQQKELKQFLAGHFLANDTSGYGDCSLSVAEPDSKLEPAAGGDAGPKGPYSGITVVDLTRVLAGPYCTKMLRLHGARVIKVEVPVRGDDSRMFGPFVNDESVYFQCVNHGKESIALNLKDEKDKAVLEQLLERADMLVENFRPGVMDKLGYAWEDLHKRFPRLILVSISGYGQDGPASKKPAYDAVVQGEGGIMSLTGYDFTGPTRVGISIGDSGAGLYAAIGAQAALFHRAATGEATRVDVSMLDCQVALQNIEITSYLATGKLPTKTGSRHRSIAPFQAFETEDVSIMIAGGNDTLFRKIAQTLGRAEWSDDERYRTNAARVKNLDALASDMSAVLRTRPAEHWTSLLEKAGVPCGPISTLDAVTRHAQVQSRNMIVAAAHPSLGAVKMAGLPIKYTAFSDVVRLAPAPALDQHRDKVLGELSKAG